ncbi:hypothetical protein FS837_003592 [Tulasnella sp. UAMH 9824]|nr:hypothetical protein FS837_003592 [Tulasnella sp. UAMH 9824]
MRARDTPLILYTREGRGINEANASLVKQMLKEKYASQIAAIRVVGSGDEYLFLDLLKKGMTLLETLEVSSELWPGGDKEPSRQSVTFELPRLRNLVAKSWEPPADSPWLSDLQSLGIRNRRGLGANVLRLLNTCVNLQTLELGSAEWEPRLAEEDYSDVPAQIALTKLRNLTLKLAPSRFLGQIVRRLIIPPETPGLIHINHLRSPLSDDLNTFIEDLRQFIFLQPGSQWVVDKAIFEINGRSATRGRSMFTYIVGCRWIGLWPETQDRTYQDQIVDIITNLQRFLHNPSLKVVVIDQDRCDTFLRKLADLGGVERIRIKGRVIDIERALASIGSRRPNLPTGAITDADWPFESLKELVVEDLTLSIDHLITLVGIRQPYLQSVSKTWLERISLVNCQFTGMSVERAVSKFATLGVVLVCSGRERASRP